MGVLSNLEPVGVFRFFEEICGIPHGSSDTKRISDYLVRFAENRGLRYIQDECNNVIIFKDGTDGYEDSKPVMLQGHMDMVCEKDADCDIDFEKDGLKLRLENEIISADGTTLGGDDGIAVAFALAILDSDDIPHPPLECVFTVDEEIGMLGAAEIDCSPLKSRTMLNLDSEDEGYLLVSCAGGACVTCHIPVEYENDDGDSAILKVTMDGLTGGHSGVEIIKQRANADKQIARLLYNIGRDISYRLITIQGGLKDNAIPNSSEAYVLIKPENVDNFVKLAEKCEQIFRHEFENTDPDMKVRVERVSEVQNVIDSGKTAHCICSGIKVMTENSGEQVIRSLMMMPNGVQKMSQDIEGLVQTSLNLGILKSIVPEPNEAGLNEGGAGKGEVTASFSVRSSVQTEKEYLIDQLRCVVNSAKGYIDVQGDYPAWEYRHDSPLRDIMVDVFEKQYGRKPVIQALHAGVECGLFAGKMPGLDCVSFGPDMKNIHTSRESMDVASVQRTWRYTLGILERLK